MDILGAAAAVDASRRPRAWLLREAVDAIRSVLRGGMAWRALPHDDPPSQTAPHSVGAWPWDGTWERRNDEVRELVRERAGRNQQPSAGLLDSQSAKTTAKGPRGHDGTKKLSGRQRHGLGDTGCLILRVVVHPADSPDRDGAPTNLRESGNASPRCAIWGATPAMPPRR